MITLRDYQKEAAEAFIQSLKCGCNPIVMLPTGGGKSLIIADVGSYITSRGGRVVVLAHVQELLKQNSEEYARYSQRSDYGVYSSGLGRQEVASITFAGIQSVYRNPNLFSDTDLIIVDEAHSVPPENEGLMYTTFFNAIPKARRSGFTATPWRLDGGVIYGEGRYFDTLAYQKSPLELVDEGYLSPLVGVETNCQLNISGVAKTAGEYSMSGVQKKMEDDGWLEKAIAHSVAQLKGRKHILIFCPTIETSRAAAELYKKYKVSCGYVDSEGGDREATLAMWTAGEIRACANVDILTTGFNFPALDAIVCLRPTESSSLWVQMLGRGMRKAMGKDNCLVLDYAGNLERLGGVSTMETWNKQKEDGKMEERDAPTAKKGAVKKGMKLALTSLDPMLESKSGLRVRVLRVNYAVTRAKIPGKQHLLASYECETDNGISVPVSSFCCVEYTGGARFHAEQWFKRRGSTAPKSAQSARVEAYSLPCPRELVIRRNDGFINVEREIF
jgi:DNA repair protein RadD